MTTPRRRSSSPGWTALHLGLSSKVDPGKHTVWLTDNTAWRADGRPDGSWTAEFVAAYFARGSGEDASEFVAAVSEFIGVADDPGERETIAERVQPFVDQILPGYSVEVDFGGRQTITLGPAGDQGISSNQLVVPGGPYRDGEVVTSRAVDSSETAPFETFFAKPEGWTIISDVDDTIKISNTFDPVKLAETTFVDQPKPVPGMPDLYQHLRETLSNPAFFYLTASPYNLYQFLHGFRTRHFPTGTMILRDASWMTLAGFLMTLTQGTRDYKLDRMEKIHRWLPRRKVLCIGDSTQADPEVYAEMYRRYPDWIRAIYIRRVPGGHLMERKNRDERFAKAFEGVPAAVWSVFDDPAELYLALEGLDIPVST